MNNTAHTRITERLALYRDEVARLPGRSSGIRVREGIAWLTADGSDQIVSAGESVEFAPGKFAAVLMALGSERLIVEVLGTDRPQITQVEHSAGCAGNTARLTA